MARDQAEAGMIKSRTTSESFKSGYSKNQFTKTHSSIKSARNKESKESRVQKQVAKNLNDISQFKGDPPDAEILLAILK